MIRFTFTFLLVVTILEIHVGTTSWIPARINHSTQQVRPFHISKNIFRIHLTKTVMMVNQLQNGQNLKIHCKSKDNDLGVKVVPPNGWYSFKFRPHILEQNTLFFCSFVWSGETLKYFEVYKEKTEQCYRCVWLIRNDGPCMYISKTYECFSWRT